jgi:chemotaxis protein CheC
MDAEVKSSLSAIESVMEETMRACVDHAVDGLNEMVGATYEVAAFDIRCASLLLLPGFVANPEVDAVGVYLKAIGPVGGQLLMVMPMSLATDMVERMTGAPLIELGSLEISALGEAGNLMSGYFLRILEENSTISARPSPPLVLVDMLSAILEAVAVSNPDASSSRKLIHAAFQLPGVEGRADFWVVFDETDPCSSNA